ncbi:MAG: KpsF/GutQ family sugar-phosphate isomerase [Alphaproteobacteria bacterium]|nr:KpsF/GutQ family sugar-phosphate isomerase [Alphaproteobacteria bacterium]
MTALAETPTQPADIASARRTLRLEIAGIEALAAGLGQPFVAALDLFAAAAGRIVVTGMGKSGHVARKIAATLASTGAPALFVHPAEASHGDLGMIAGGDAVLALSNSGETPELTDIVAYSRRFQIPLVAMTRRRPSTLADAADVALVLPDVEEACPLGLAPTTSTTQMLALGDAIAVALLERRGFSAADFRVFHPGGKLGRRLLRVADLMHGGDEVPVCSPGAAMAEAILEMSAKTFGVVGVVAPDGSLVGIITDGDLRRHMGPALLERTAASVMTRTPRTIGPDALAAEALGFMSNSKVYCVFVVDAQHRPVGVLRMHDLLRAGIV